MRDLKEIREDWNRTEAEETQMLRQMSLSHGLHTFALLYESFASRFRDEEESYLAERETILIERQRRLASLAEWLEANPNESPLRISDTHSEASR